jgi:hypothetical protein
VFLFHIHPLKDAKYPLTSFVHSINAMPPMEHSALWRCWVFKLLNEEEAIFWIGVAWWFSFHTRGDLGHGWYFPHVSEHKIQ